jgi:uncharacterized membrane protein YesL
MGIKMGNIFNLDNGFFTTINKLIDILLLSIIWVIICIPIITIGPATTALYYTVVKVIRRERGYLLSEFFKCFKDNFKTGALAGIIMTILAIALYADRKIVSTFDGNLYFFMFSIFNAMILLLFCVSIYVFPILSRFNVGLKQLFKSSLLMAIKHLPTTILMAVIIIAFMLGIYIMPPVAFVGPALCFLLCSFLLERVFKKYMPEKSADGNSTTDEWYLE